MKTKDLIIEAAEAKSLSKIKKIGILTSGGDSPGMNAAIRAVTRCAIDNGIKVYGIQRGYQGLIEGEFIELDRYSVSDTMQRGGTMLKTARSEDFKTEAGQERAASILQTFGIDALVAIGGAGQGSSDAACDARRGHSRLSYFAGQALA